MHWKKIVIILVILSAAVGLFFMMTRKTSRPRNNGQPPAAINADKQEPIGAQAKKNIEERLRTDSDLDGLTDEEEKTYGTDQNLSDTDGDGVLDPDEIKRFHSDPNKRDSDSDGVNDGEELRQGTNPLRQ